MSATVRASGSGDERSERWLLRGAGLFRAWMALSLPIATPFLLPRVRRPVLLLAIEAAWIAASALLFARAARPGRLSRGAAWVDVAVTSGLVLATAAVGLPRWTELGNLASGWANASAVSAGATSRRTWRSIPPSLVLAAAFVASRAIGGPAGGSHVAEGLASEGFVTVLALGVAASVTAAILRRWGRQLDEAAARTSEQAAALAAAQARARSSRELHDHLLQVLELVGRRSSGVDEEAHRLASEEAARIRAGLASVGAEPEVAQPVHQEAGVRLAERTLANCVVVFRVAVLPFGVLLVPLAVADFRRPGLAIALAGVAAFEGAWLAWTVARRGAHRSVATAVGDVACCALVASGLMMVTRPAALGDSGTLLAPFLMGALLAAGIAVGRARPVVWLVVGSSALYLGAVAAAAHGSTTALLTAVVDEALWYAGWAAGGVVLGRELRDAGAALDRERELAAAHAAALAVEREHEIFMRELGERSLGVLDAIVAAGGGLDGGLRREAGRSAEWLRAYLRDGTRPSEPRSLVAALTEAALEARDAGLDVRLQTASLGEAGRDLDPAIVEAIAGGIREALRNVAKHSGSASATVRATRRDGRLVVTVVDAGRGLDGEPPGFGLTSSISARVREAGGDVAIDGAPGEGVRVELSFALETSEAAASR
ncbi:MAG: ATP-binding protein [Planctomycetaceae bacterium]